MPKLTKEQRAELEAQLAADDADEDDSFEVEFGEDGKYARLPYAKAKSWLQKTFGIDLDEVTADPPADDKGKKPAAKKDEGEGGEVRRFSRRVG